MREDEREINRMFSATPHLEEPHLPSVVEKQVLSTPTTNGSETSGERE